MKLIIDHASTLSWHITFVPRTTIKFIERFYESAFNVNGSLNMYKNPKFSKFKKAISDAKKILKELLIHRHSPSNASNDESHLDHLKSIIKIWVELKSGAEENQS